MRKFHRFFISCLGVSILAFASLSAALAADVGQNEALFEDTQGGNSLKYSWPRDVPTLGNMNDKISFITAGQNTIVSIFKDAYYSGNCYTFFGNDQETYPNASTLDLASDPVAKSFNNKASSLIVRSGDLYPSTCTEPGENEAVFWQNINFGGAQFRLLAPGNYADLRSIKAPSGNWNDKISSMKLGEDVRVLAYSNINYAGACLVYTSSGTGGRTNNYGDLRAQNTNLSSGTWNDQISSLRVVVSSTRTCP